MGDKSNIEWTDATWPIVQGCDYVSPGCTHCYAPRQIWRQAHSPNAKVSLPVAGLVEPKGGNLVWTGKIACREDRLDWPKKWTRPRMIFVPSLGDLFHEDVPDAFIHSVFEVMENCPRHTFQVLTKRAKRMRKYVNCRWGGFRGPAREHIWLGVSAEDQQRADERIPELVETIAVTRFLSLEPLLGAIELWVSLPFTRYGNPRALEGIHWVIVGGESGPHARPMHPDWARWIRDECQSAAVPFFFKQWGEFAPLPDPFHYSPAFGSGNREYSSALRKFAARHGASILLDDRQEGWDKTTIETGTCITDGETAIGRVGKHAAGRLLDGREWSEFPGGVTLS